MPNKLTKLLSRTAKEKEAEAEVERNKQSPSPPPAYNDPPADYDASNAIHPPDISAGFKNLKLTDNNGDLPDVGRCIAHLKLLECFYRLRQKVGSTDGLFGIENKVVLQYELPDKENDELFAKLAEKRWAIYVSRAVDRFEVWSKSLFPDAPMARSSDLREAGREGTLCDPAQSSSSPFKIDTTNLPPIDVLMVWHSYMLNPRAYLEDCLRLNRMPMWHAGFPWQAAVDMIDSESFIYNVDEDTSAAFTAKTGLAWDNLHGTDGRQLDCPDCEAKVTVRSTTCYQAAPQKIVGEGKDEVAKALDKMLSSGNGFCDKDFVCQCEACSTIITHDRLKAMKFCKDVQLSLDHDVPMGGTLLGGSGIPWKFETESDYTCAHYCQFPNELMQAGLGKKILDDIASTPSNQRMKYVRAVIESKIHDGKLIRSLSKITQRSLARGQRIAIRRMMSRYWENSSPFALDLVGAVIRQGGFVEKMHNIDWLHSPALPSTMKRLLIKYDRFVFIMANNNRMAVPTLDVDLAWHTHQLSPYSYMKYTVHTTKQFVDHDDKVAETKLNDSFAWTSKTYEKLYGEPYSECTCWYCEAIREMNSSAISRLFNSNNNVDQANEQLHKTEQDPRKSVHISAHNAVRPDDKVYQADAAYKAGLLEQQYQRACQRAKRKGRPPPKRNDYYYSEAYGYPVYTPAYAPFLLWGAYTPMYYPVSPGCMALGAGAYGNCCSGTCGGAVAAGGCGNAGGCAGGMAGGAGACAGGAAGGCGGGGGGGCGGGGCGGCGGGGGGG